MNKKINGSNSNPGTESQPKDVMKVSMKEIKAETGWFAGKQVDLDNVYRAIKEMEQKGYKADPILKMLYSKFKILTTPEELNLFLHNREAEKAIKARKKIGADVNSVIQKVKDRMTAWKKHNPDTYKNIMAWFNMVVQKASFSGLPDVAVHLGLSPEEYKTMKQYVVQVRRALI